MASSWQPISTAPKDGTAILIFQKSATTGSKMRVAFWRNDTVPRGWSPSEESPTHWMTLPVPPDQQINEESGLTSVGAGLRPRHWLLNKTVG